MKYSREYEKQADLVGAQIMARAGYDPRDLARMFETIAKQGGGSPPQWLSQPSQPGNRTQYINAEAAQLRIGPSPSTPGFSRLAVAPVVDAAGAHHGGARTQRRCGRRRWPDYRRLGRSHRRCRAAAIAPIPDRPGAASCSR